LAFWTLFTTSGGQRMPLRQLDQHASARRWIQQTHERQGLDDDGLFDLPF
jgi:hypothetical protein